MTADRDPFWIRRPVASVFIAIIALFVLGWIGWGIKVAMSPVKGTGDVIIKNQDADNRIQAQAKFEKLYNGIIALDKNIDPFAATVRAHPNDRIAQQNLDGQIQMCNNAVAEYDAESEKTLSKDWKREDLPLKINTDDPRTDCKESGAR